MERTIKVYQEDGQLRVKVDAPGERAVSAPVDDPAELIEQIADAAGLDVLVEKRTP